ncbi:uncharacterized protein LOC124901299 isoform X6 [Homo sapiens]|uniref:uncharacterized protein LOC124901299 isoform X6 n=2 Tax=Homo sapiens TaxID=9606 RepID=UPI001FB07E05|nr:uncharacterized protein LOC124901299 isoform X6 [Homo sapiens]
MQKIGPEKDSEVQTSVMSLGLTDVSTGKRQLRLGLKPFKPPPPPLLRFCSQGDRRKHQRDEVSESETSVTERKMESQRAVGVWGAGGTTYLSHWPCLCAPGPKPQKDSVSDWAIVLITLTLVAAIVSLMYGIKKACQFRREMSLGCGCGSVTPYSSHHEGEAASQRYSCQMKGRFLGSLAPPGLFHPQRKEESTVSHKILLSVLPPAMQTAGRCPASPRAVFSSVEGRTRAKWSAGTFQPSRSPGSPLRLALEPPRPSDSLPSGQVQDPPLWCPLGLLWEGGEQVIAK